MSAATWWRYSVSATIRPATNAPSAIDRPACSVAKLAPSTSRSVIAVNTSSASSAARKANTGRSAKRANRTTTSRTSTPLAERQQQRLEPASRPRARAPWSGPAADRPRCPGPGGSRSRRGRAGSACGRDRAEPAAPRRSTTARGRRRPRSRLRSRAPSACAIAGDRASGDQELGQAQDIDPGPDQAQALDLQLQPEIEQEEHDAEVGQLAHRLELVHHAEARWSDHRAADQEAQHACRGAAARTPPRTR